MRKNKKFEIFFFSMGEQNKKVEKVNHVGNGNGKDNHVREFPEER